MFCSSSSSSTNSSSNSRSRRSGTTNRNNIRRRVVQRIDPLIRSALATTIQDEMTNPTQQELPQMTTTNRESELESAVVSSVTQPPPSSQVVTVRQQLHDIQQEIHTAQEQLQVAMAQEILISQRSHKYQTLLDELAFRIKTMQQQQQHQQQHQSTIGEGTAVDKNEENDCDDLESGITTSNEASSTLQQQQHLLPARKESAEDESDSKKEETTPTMTIDSSTTSGATTTTTTSSTSQIQRQQVQTQLLHRMMEKWETNQTALEDIRRIHVQIISTCETIRRTIVTLQQQQQSLEQMIDDCTTFVSLANINSNNDATLETDITTTVS